MRTITMILLTLIFMTPVATLGYPIKEFPKPFVKDGTIDYNYDGVPDIAIIIGADAHTSDMISAIMIAAKIGSHLYYKNAPYVMADQGYVNEGLQIGGFQYSFEKAKLVYQETENGILSFIWSPEADPFNKIYPLDDSYVFVPSGLVSPSSPITFSYSLGRKINPMEFSDWIKFAPSYYPPVYHEGEKNYATEISIDCPGTFDFDYDAWDTTPNFKPVSGPIHYSWEHGGFYFIHPHNPVDLREGQSLEVPWLGYKLVVDGIEFSSDYSSYRISLKVTYLHNDVVVDYFHLENDHIPKENDPSSFDTFIYSKIHDDVYIDAGVRAIPYIGFTVRDVDAVLRVASVDIYSLIIAPNVYPGSYSYTDPEDATTYTFYLDTMGWPHESGSDYYLAATSGSPHVNILTNATYPYTGRVIMGGNFALDYSAQLFNHPFAYYIDNTLLDLSMGDNETFLGISSYSDDWYVIVRHGYINAGLLQVDQDGFYTPMDINHDGVLDENDGKLVAGNETYWLTSLNEYSYSLDVECPAMPSLSLSTCGPSCGPTWALYRLESGYKTYSLGTCPIVNETVFGYGSASSCPEFYSDVEYLEGAPTVMYWEKSVFYPVNVTGVYAGIYDRVEDVDGDALYLGARNLSLTYTSEGVGFEDTTPSNYTDLRFENEEVFSFIRAPLAYLDDWVIYIEDGIINLREEIKDKNLILIGGPAVNKLVAFLNDYGYLPILFRQTSLGWILYDPESNTNLTLSYMLATISPELSNSSVYSLGDEGSGLGVIEYANDNPWGDGIILVVAGTDRYGTLSAGIALTDPTKLYMGTVSAFATAGVENNRSAVVVIGIEPTTVLHYEEVVRPVIVVPVGVPPP